MIKIEKYTAPQKFKQIFNVVYTTRGFTWSVKTDNAAMCVREIGKKNKKRAIGNRFAKNSKLWNQKRTRLNKRKILHSESSSYLKFRRQYEYLFLVKLNTQVNFGSYKSINITCISKTSSNINIWFNPITSN